VQQIQGPDKDMLTTDAILKKTSKQKTEHCISNRLWSLRNGATHAKHIQTKTKQQTYSKTSGLCRYARYVQMVG